MMRTLLVGGTSAIGERIARHLAAAEHALYLTARDIERLQVVVADLKVRGALRAESERLDVTDTDDLAGLVSRAANSLGGLDQLVLMVGNLPDQPELNRDPSCLRRTMVINATSAMILLNEAAALFGQQGHGQIVAIGSVAGDRGRATNYAYGAAKGAIEIFMSGLRQRLHNCGVKVLLVKPGFVDTPMTKAFEKGPLWASPERVAKDIVRAMEKSKPVIYTPWYWRWIMLVIRLIPEPIFVRLRF